MRLGHKSSFRNSMKAGSNNSRKRPYGLLLLLAMGAAVLSVVVLHKLRERRIFGILLQDQDRELVSLQLLLQKERENGKELRRKLEDMKAKAISSKTKKMDLTNKLMEAEATAAYLKEKQREAEIALEKKENQVNVLTNKEAESIKENLQVAELLRQKEAEVEEMKHHFADLKHQKKETTEDNITANENVTNNGKVDTPSRDGQLDSSTNPSDGRTSVEEAQVDSSIQLAGTQDVKSPQEGQWVSFKTNKDEEGLKQDNQSDVGQRGADFSNQQKENQHPGKFEVSQDNEQVEKNQESTTKDPSNSHEVENSQYANEGQHQKLEVSQDNENKKMDQEGKPEDPNNSERVENSQYGNEGQYQKLQASQENENRVKNQESTLEDSINSQKLDISQLGNEDQKQKLEISQNNENKEKNHESTPKDPNNSQIIENSRYRNEGQYQKPEVQESASEDSNQKVEFFRYGNEGQYQRVEKLESSQDRENKLDRGEKDQESISVAPKEEEKVELSQEINKEDGGEKGQESIQEISKDKKNDENYQQGNIDQQVTAETTGTGKWEDDTVITDGQSSRTKNKRRRRKIRKGRRVVNQNYGHLEISENNNSENKRDQNADINTVEPNKMEAFSGQPELPERTVAEDLVVENGDGNKNAPESKEEVTPSDSSKSEMMVNSHSSEVSIANTENVVHSDVGDDSVGRDGTRDKNESENKDNERSSTVTKLEMPEGPQNDASLSTRNQSNVSDSTEGRNETDAQSQNLVNNVSDASQQLHEGDNVSEDAHVAKEKEVKSTENQLEMNKDAQVDENKEVDEKTGNIADLPKDAIMEGTEKTNTEEKPGQTQASSTTGEHQSQSSLGTTDTANTSSDKDSKIKDAELPDNAENKQDDSG